MKKTRYYIIDGDMANVESLEEIIKSGELGSVCGYCTEPEEAVEEILEEIPDIVLVDLLMEGMDGITVVRKVKERNPDISFVMISRVRDKTLVQKAYGAGVEFYVHHPLNRIEVESVLRNVADRIRMSRIMGSLKDMFEEESISLPCPKQDDGASMEVLFGMLGMLGEKGMRDIRHLYCCMRERDGSYSKELIRRVAREKGDTVRNVEQRIRRAIKKSLTNAATAGLDDYGSELFAVYAGYVFDFKTLRDEMNFINGKTRTGGRVSISRFMEGLELYRKSL